MSKKVVAFAISALLVVPSTNIIAGGAFHAQQERNQELSDRVDLVMKTCFGKKHNLPAVNKLKADTTIEIEQQNGAQIHHSTDPSIKKKVLNFIRIQAGLLTNNKQIVNAIYNEASDLVNKSGYIQEGVLSAYVGEDLKNKVASLCARQHQQAPRNVMLSCGCEVTGKKALEMLVFSGTQKCPQHKHEISRRDLGLAFGLPVK